MKTPRQHWLERGAARGFTLIEIMVVVAIIGIVMAMGIPSILSGLKREGIRKATADLLEACEKARAQAIVNGVTTAVQFHPFSGDFSVGTGGSETYSIQADSASQTGGGARMVGGFSARLPDSVKFEMLDVNLVEYSAADEALVRFFPNGTCDEMVAILLSDQNERRVVSLEITTAMPSVCDDPRKLLR